MKTLTVQEAQGQLGQLIAEANRGDVIMLTNGTQRVTLTAEEHLDPEQDSPELEAELLKSIDGPYSPYSSDEMRAIVERIIREEKRGSRENFNRVLSKVPDVEPEAPDRLSPQNAA